MQQKEGITETLITLLVILVAFVWIGYAYVTGINSNQMVLHPIVPFLLIPLLLSFRKHESTKNVIIIALVFIGLWVFVRLQGVFMPFLIGFSLAYVVNVAFMGLQDIPLPKGKRLHLPKWAAIVVLLLLLIGIITFLALGIVPQLTQQVSDMQDGMFSFYEQIRNYTMTTAENMQNGVYPLKDQLPQSWQGPVGEYIDKMMIELQTKIPSLTQSVSQIIGNIIQRLTTGFIGTVGKISSISFILIVFVYAIQSFRTHIEKIRDLFPELQRERITRYAREIDRDMRAFLKGQLTIIVIISLISIIAYSIIRVPFALLVGVLAGLCNAIPTVGPILGGGIAILAGLTGFAAGNVGFTGFLFQVLLIVGAVIGIQALDNSFISPRIMSKAVEVHPLVVMFAVLLAASLMGIWGAILTIPSVVIIKGIINVRKQINKESKE
jgi:predicted PurR-regulated permease PerM